MTSEQATGLVKTEMAGDWSRSSAHGVNLKACLVRPQQRDYEDGFQPDKRLRLWLALEEDSVNQSGYKIVFDEAKGIFGLAVCGREQDVFIMGEVPAVVRENRCDLFLTSRR